MKKNEFIKKAIDKNIADKEGILYSILNSCSNEYSVKKKRTGYKRIVGRIAASFVVIVGIACTGIFSNLPHGNPVQIHQGKKTTDINNMFTLVAYATENPNSINIQNGTNMKKETKTVLNPNVKVQMPFGKIKRGKYNTFLYENGKRYEGYEVELDERVGFVCTGKNIESVTFTSSKGMLRYFDVDLLKKMEANGEVYICKIPISRSKLDPEWDMKRIKKVFNQMWSSGELDEYKNKYFNGKDIDLDDYSIGFHSRDNFDSDSMFMIISNKKSGSPVYLKEGTTVVAKPNVSVTWEPTKAMDMIMAYTPLNYQDLPGDTITVTAKFYDEQTITQTIMLSFDKEGNIIAEVNN